MNLLRFSKQVMSILTSSKDLLVLMKNIDKAFHSKQTGPGNSTVNELSRFVPSIREQLKVCLCYPSIPFVICSLFSGIIIK